jgi:Protein of unknown function (DUF742)
VRASGHDNSAPDGEGHQEDDDEFLVRPYTVTRGRTAPRYQLEIEAMVTASHYDAGDVSRLSPECQAILDFCRDWRSVAEVSAVLRLPLGVARVLITDLATEGLVRIHQRDQEQRRPDTKLLERVLQGIRRLLCGRLSRRQRLEAAVSRGGRVLTAAAFSRPQRAMVLVRTIARPPGRVPGGAARASACRPPGGRLRWPGPG